MDALEVPEAVYMANYDGASAPEGEEIITWATLVR